METYIHKSTIMLPYTNQEANAMMSKSKFKHFNVRGTRLFATHLVHSMLVSAKLFLASIAACVNGVIPSALRYTAASICLSIIEDDLQNNRMPPQASREKQKQSGLNETGLNDISMSDPRDEDKLQ